MGLGIFALVLVVYALQFHQHPVSDSPEAWGQFGDFVGGLANPLIGLLAFLGLLVTIYENRREIGLTRMELRNSSNALQRSNELNAEHAKWLKREKDLDDLARAMAAIAQDLGADLERAGAFEGLTDPQAIRAYQVIRKSLGADFYDKSLAYLLAALADPKSGVALEEARELVKPKADVIAFALVELRNCLADCDRLGGAGALQRYYTSRFRGLVSSLAQLAVLREDVVEFFSVRK